jgi:hypothetical protein
MIEIHHSDNSDDVDYEAEINQDEAKESSEEDKKKPKKKGKADEKNENQ